MRVRSPSAYLEANKKVHGEAHKSLFVAPGQHVWLCCWHHSLDAHEFEQRLVVLFVMDAQPAGVVRRQLLGSKRDGVVLAG